MAEQHSLSLLELNEQVKQTLKLSFATPVWIRAEIAELHENANGHCYLEFVEKSSDSDLIVAKQKAMIWSFTYRLLKPYFESSTGTALAVGMKVLVSCQIEFHELYGMSLNVRDIDPIFTVGEMAVRRAEIIRRLTSEGVADMNKQLEIPFVPQRIAVVSSASAAGFGDFQDQLEHNAFGYQFYVKLFPAVMQGSQTEQSVITALGKIADNQDLFDVVVLIRGGGSTSDLAAFDNYNLALHCAQFPLPIISGIGHQRDDSIVDLVAHTRVKTPTAAAEFLVDCMQEADAFVTNLASSLANQARLIIIDAQNRQQTQIMRLPQQVKQIVNGAQLVLQAQNFSIKQAVKKVISNEEKRLDLLTRFVEMSDPYFVLNRGYSYTEKDGKKISSVSQLAVGDQVDTYFSDGKTTSIINKTT